MSLSSLIRQCRHIKGTVRSTYGNGIGAWGSYIYYALFRINKFKILQAKLDEPLVELTCHPDVTLLNPPICELELLRSRENLPREFYCNQFQKVNSCMIALVNGDIAYIHWVYHEGEFSRFLKIGSDSAEINYVITLPEYRGRGIAATAFIRSMTNLKKQGIKKVFAVVHEENIASIKSFIRAGFVEVGNTFSIGPFNRKKSV